MHKSAAVIQAMLFVATEPISLDGLAKATNLTVEEVKLGLGELKLNLEDSGLAVVEHEGAIRLVTAPRFASLIKNYMIGETRNELSRPALETLAIIAYRGPATKSAIEEIRGVSSDTMLRNLLQRGLIHEAGTAKVAGRPTLYAVSHEFLQQFGFASLSELPALQEDIAT